MDNQSDSPKSQADDILEKDEFENENPTHTKFMLEYLVNKCNFFCEENCLFAHAGDPPRRKPFRLSNKSWNYIPQECLLGSQCEFQNKCMFAHSAPEIKYHPMLYKTFRCSYPTHNGICSKLGIYCYMAHNDQRKASEYSLDPSISACNETTVLGQLEANKSNLENYSTYKSYDKNHYVAYNRNQKQEAFNVLTFKTRVCEKKNAHNEKICLFYHQDNLDRRRKHNFNTVPCPNVFNSETKRFENKECEIGETCKNAHTENEILYHIDNYKKNQCTQKNCILGDCCPNLHIEQNSKSVKEIEDEIKSLKDNYSGLLKCLEENKKNSDRLKKFVCVFCKKKVNEVLKCGHLVCGTCGVQKCCGVTKKGQKIMFSK